MNIYNGNAVTDAKGFATVELPGYFDVENISFKYQLTCIGQFAQAIVKEEVKDNKFLIQTDKSNVKVSWQVTGVRNDAYAQAHRVVPEVEKRADEKGKYLHPELFGARETDRIGYRDLNCTSTTAASKLATDNCSQHRKVQANGQSNTEPVEWGIAGIWP